MKNTIFSVNFTRQDVMTHKYCAWNMSINFISIHKLNFMGNIFFSLMTKQQKVCKHIQRGIFIVRMDFSFFLRWDFILTSDPLFVDVCSHPLPITPRIAQRWYDPLKQNESKIENWIVPNFISVSCFDVLVIQRNNLGMKCHVYCICFRRSIRSDMCAVLTNEASYSYFHCVFGDSNHLIISGPVNSALRIH